MWQESEMEVQIERMPIRITQAPSAPRIQPRMKIGELLAA
jgi:hypothetical protein